MDKIGSIYSIEKCSNLAPTLIPWNQNCFTRLVYSFLHWMLASLGKIKFKTLLQLPFSPENGHEKWQFWWNCHIFENLAWAEIPQQFPKIRWVTSALYAPSEVQRCDRHLFPSLLCCQRPQTYLKYSLSQVIGRGDICRFQIVEKYRYSKWYPTWSFLLLQME